MTVFGDCSEFELEVFRGGGEEQTDSSDNIDFRATNSPLAHSSGGWRDISTASVAAFDLSRIAVKD